MPSEGAAARCWNVERLYRTPAETVHALRGVTVDIPRGRVTAIAGPSGSGKSSLLRILAGIDRPTSGTVVVEGLPLQTARQRRLRRLRRSRIGYLFQRPSDNFLAHLTVGEHLRMAAVGSGYGPQVDDVAAALGMANHLDQLPAQLSGGEQQRAAVAQLLVAGATFVVADEPTAELDDATAGILLDEIGRQVDRGVTFVLATHDPTIRRAADQLVELEHGRLRRSRPAAGHGSGPGWPAGAADLQGDLVAAVRKVSRAFHRGDEIVHAVEGVSLELRRGEIVGLVGRSGSGKSTLLNLLAGWDDPDEGSIDRGDASRLRWRDVAVVPQHLGLIDELTLRRNIAYPLRLAGAADADERVTDLLEGLDLENVADRYPSETSLGEQQRAAIARALVIRPTLLLADEPTAHQDHESARRIAAAIRAAAAGGSCCVVATHDPETQASFTRTVHMSEGRVTAG